MYVIIGKYRGEKEQLDTAKTMTEAQYLKREYEMAYGSEWIITIKTKKND